MKAYFKPLGLFVVIGLFLGGCSLPIVASIKTVTRLPRDRNTILNITDVNDQTGWYLVNPTDWKMSKWEFPNNSPNPLNEETRRSNVSWSSQSQRLLYAKKSVSSNGVVEVLKIDDKGDLNSNQQILSPDGKTIAYTDGSRIDKTFGIVEDIYLFDIASQRSRRITQLAPGTVYQLVWSPESKSLAFWHWDTKKTSKTLYQINSDGSNLRVLLDAKDDLPTRIHPSFPSFNDEKIKWSPDGHYLALLSSSKANNSVNSQTIWLLDVTTKKLRELFPAPPKTPGGGIQDFAWSPDSQKIVFAAGYDGKCRPSSWLALGGYKCTNFLYLVDVNGGQPTKVTKIPQDSATRLLWLEQQRQ
jgi:dipeptidyl aminopeptidase/acylaminoacyl peptidase